MSVMKDSRLFMPAAGVAGTPAGLLSALRRTAPSRPAPPAHIITGEKALAAPMSAAATTSARRNPSICVL
jgi:hypothetical protein